MKKEAKLKQVAEDVLKVANLEKEELIKGFDNEYEHGRNSAIEEIQKKGRDWISENFN